MADVAKPAGSETVVIPAETAPVAPAAPAVAEPTIPPATSAEPGSEPRVEEPAAQETKEEAKEELKEEPKEEAKPVYEGSLQYNAGSTIKSFIGLKEKYFFYYGEDAVASDKLQHLLKPTKTELKETIAWAHHTGKGLLFFVKHADHKASPKGVIGLSDVEELKAAGTVDISFKLHGTKHILVAESKTIRDGWLLSLEEKIAEAKTLKEEIHAKDSFKEQVDSLGKPAVVAVAKTEAKKSSEAERSARAETTDAKKAANKDRSQSRGKRLLDTIRGKKEAEKSEAKAEAKADVKAEDEPLPATETIAGPAVTEATETTAAPVAPVISEEKTEEVKNNKARRSSKFFDRIIGAVSDKKEPAEKEAVPEKIDAEAPVLPTTETEPLEVPEVKAEEPVSPTVPPKDERRRSSFFGLGSLRKPSEKKITKEEPEKADAELAEVEEAAKPEDAAKPVEDETPAVAPIEAKEEPKEKKENAFVGIKRSLSKALHGDKKKDKKPAKKVDDVKEETAEADKPDKVEADKAEDKPAVIGDVVPEAVIVGSPTPAPAPVVAAPPAAAPPATTTVQAAA